MSEKEELNKPLLKGEVIINKNMGVIKQIHEDEREIRSIYWNDCDGSCITVGQFGYTEIKAYAEGGMHCGISFLACCKDNIIVSRVPAWQVQIVYKYGGT